MTPLSGLEQKAVLNLVDLHNRVLVDSIERIQAIETFLLAQPATASAFRTSASAETLEATKSNLHSSAQALRKALSGIP